MKQVKSDEISAYHIAFSCFIAARNYYSKESTKNSTNDSQDTQKKIKSIFIKNHRNDISFESANYNQMLKYSHSSRFKQIIQIEINQLKSMDVWKEISISEKTAEKHFISTIWVFKYKFDEERYLVKYKAKLCVRENKQQTDQNIYAITLAIRIFRALIIIITTFDLETKQYDAINAFINSEIDESIYCISSQKWNDSEKLFFFFRALYELKQSSTLWYQHFFNILCSLRLKKISEIECLFVNEFMIIFFFVDDIAIIYDRRHVQKVDEFQIDFFQVYEMKYLEEVKWFLNIRITKDRTIRKLSLYQNFYINKLISKFHVNISFKTSEASLSSFEEFKKNSKQATAEQILSYQQRIDSINFSAITIKSDTAQATSKLSEFLINSFQKHLDAADRVLRYLTHTKEYSIIFDSETESSKTIFLESSDASYADDLLTRRSFQKYCFRLFNEMIDWKSFKQKTITTSFIETKLLILSTAFKELFWWKRFFDSIEFKLKHSTQIQCDNMQTIRVFINDSSQFTIKFRHVNIHKHWLRQKVQNHFIYII